MPELPEIASRAYEMQHELVGKTISAIEILQPKCINIEAPDFIAALMGAKIISVTYKGKWLFVETTQGHLLFNLGMGGELLLRQQDDLPEKHRIVFLFDDQTCLAVNFWWFGHAHFVKSEALSQHEMTARLGPNALDVSAAQLQNALRGQRKRIKAWLLDQTQIAGIGNAYIHDILFIAGLHPLRSAASLSSEEINKLQVAIQAGLHPSLEKGGAFYEMDLYGNKGGFLIEDILIGYREGQPCPKCGTIIEKVKTGSTSSYLCPHCQPLQPPS